MNSLSNFVRNSKVQLQQQLPDKSYELVSAEEASSILPSNERGNAKEDTTEWLVFDSINRMGGLERLVVICVNLDEPISALNTLFPNKMQ